MNNEKIYSEYELSAEQKRIYVLEKLNQNTTIYNMPSIVQVQFDINLDYLQNILNKVIDRHESLRTAFIVNNGKIVQRVYNQVECKIKKYILSNNQSITDIMNEFIKPFELERAPLLRVAFIEDNDKNYLLLDMHHIISDGKSEKIFLNDFYSLIEGKCLPDMEMQYKDYVKQQKDILCSKRINVAKQFWLENFKKPLEVLQLPTDYPRPEMQQFNGSKEIFEIEEDIVDKIKNFCRCNGITINQFLVTSLIVALHKITGQEDIVVGTPVDSRKKAAHNQIIGLFINTLPIRAFPKKEKTFLQLSKEIAKYMFLAMKYQDYTLDMLVKDIDFPKDLSRNPIFDVAFLFNSDIVLDEKSSTQYYETKSSKADFTIEITDFSDSLKFIIEYCTNLFVSDTCRRFGNIFINVIKQVVLLPEIKLSDISRISEEEKSKLLYEWNNTNKKFNRNDTVNDLLIRQFNKNDGIALTFGQEHIGYKQLDSYINKFAGYLRCNGVGRESIVAIMMDASIDMVIAILGIIKAGGAYLPIDKKTPKDRIDFILKDSNSKMLIADEQIHQSAIIFNRNTLPDINCEIYNINNPSDLLYVIYTSGSTGKPKGVMVKHENVCNFIYAMKDSIHLHTYKKILLLTTICFDISVLEMIVPLTLGLEVVIASNIMQNDMRSLLNYIKSTEIDILQFTPSRFNMLTMFEGWEEALYNVKTILIGGESFSENLLKKLSKLPELEIYNMYGPTETTIWSTVSKIDISDQIITIGKPINNTQIYILNDNKECILPGEVGEIYIAGDGVTRGYVNQPELTSEKFTINPYTNK
ncbi:MAG: condensation domain-containing protein, partial [Acutalibacteraceae bacterium]|nr:condensation domain-containing protein [Acutalibacteraceae bacterium]